MSVPASRSGDHARRLSLFRDMLTRLPAAVAYLTGPEHRFELANDEYLRLVGGRDVVGLPVREALPEVAGQGYFEILDRVYATGEPTEGREAQVLLRRADGAPELVYVDFGYQPVRDEAGAVTGVLVHAADVTAHVLDRKGLELLTAELGASEERYRALFETLPYGVVYQGRDGGIIAVNPAAAQILGADVDALIGMRSQDPDWQAVREDGSPFPGDEHPAMVSLRTGERVGDVVMGVAHGRTGERRWISVTAVPDAFDDQGRPQRVYTMFSDVTEQRRTTAALAERDSFLGRLRDANVLAVLVADEHRVLDANDAFLELVGYGRDDLEEGRVDWRAITPPEWQSYDENALDELRRDGACRPFEKELLHSSGRRVPILIGAAVTDREPMRWVTFVVDLSERQRAERERAELLASARAARAEAETAEDRLAFLLRAGALAAATADRDELLRQATRLVVPALADFATVFLPADDGTLRSTAAAHGDERDAGLLASVGDYPAPPGSRIAMHEVHLTGRSLLLRDVGERLREWDRTDPGFVDVATRLRTDSLIMVPLAAGARRLGVLAMCRSTGRTAFTELDVAVVEELGRRLAAGLANAETFAREHSVAEILQRSVLPDELPAVPGLELAVRYLPATDEVEVGGDWFDAFPLGRRLVGLVLGDVVGHNLASASVMGQVRNALRAYAVDNPDPAAVLERTNHALSRLLPDAMATVFCAVLDVATGDLTYANAGHPPPLVVAPDAAPEFVGEPAGLMLGVTDRTAFHTGRRQLAPGSTLLLYSDGLVEDRNRPLGDGLEALAGVFAGYVPPAAEDACTAVERALLGGASRGDDVCLLAARLSG